LDPVLPTADNVHQVAQRADSGAKVVYVDNDPIVLAHGRAMLAEDDQTVVVRADIRRPAQILSDQAVRGLIDFGRPVAVIASAVLHHLLDEEGPARDHPRHGRRDARGELPVRLALPHPGRTLTPPRSKQSCLRRSWPRGTWRTSEQIGAVLRWTCGSPRRESCRAPGGVRTTDPGDRVPLPGADRGGAHLGRK